MIFRDMDNNLNGGILVLENLINNCKHSLTHDFKHNLDLQLIGLFKRTRSIPFTMRKMTKKISFTIFSTPFKK